jgi:hypothetical protein
MVGAVVFAWIKKADHLSVACQYQIISQFRYGRLQAAKKGVCASVRATAMPAFGLNMHKFIINM